MGRLGAVHTYAVMQGRIEMGLMVGRRAGCWKRSKRFAVQLSGRLNAAPGAVAPSCRLIPLRRRVPLPVSLLAHAASRLPSFTSFCTLVSTPILRLRGMMYSTYQRPHGAVQRMPVVSPELRVGAFERRVSVGLGLLDTAHKRSVNRCSFFSRYNI